MSEQASRPEDHAVYHPGFVKRTRVIPYSGGSGVRLCFDLVHDASRTAVTFSVLTGWRARDVLEPMGMGIDLHSPVQLYDFAPQPDTQNCEVIGGKCWCDGSALAADKLLKRMMSEGDAAVWEELESWWRDHFGERAREAASHG